MKKGRASWQKRKQSLKTRAAPKAASKLSIKVKNQSIATQDSVGDLPEVNSILFDHRAGYAPYSPLMSWQHAHSATTCRGAGSLQKCWAGTPPRPHDSPCMLAARINAALSIRTCTPTLMPTSSRACALSNCISHRSPSCDWTALKCSGDNDPCRGGYSDEVSLDEGQNGADNATKAAENAPEKDKKEDKKDKDEEHDGQVEVAMEDLRELRPGPLRCVCSCICFLVTPTVCSAQPVTHWGHARQHASGAGCACSSAHLVSSSRSGVLS